MKDEDVLNVDDLQPPLNTAERFYLPILYEGMVTTVRHMFGMWGAGKRVTVQYPEQKRSLRVENYRGVHRLNKEWYRGEDGTRQERVACVACFMCATACPAHCIHIVADESPWDDREKYPVRFDIDELRCIYCGMCEEACPVDAIELTAEFDLVGLSREEMIFDKEKLLEMYDRTKDIKPRKDPKITGYPTTADRLATAPAADAQAPEE
ncbi:MAG: NADH-quinone oxidoreductase subunit I [Phycisphaerales bacterium]|nr:MAG: NADH-quinone oxidoreductase subunit I [Phycisphaerales bacterium]